MAANSPWWPGWRWRQDGLKGVRLRPLLLMKTGEREPSLTVTASLNTFPGREGSSVAVLFRALVGHSSRRKKMYQKILAELVN